MAQINLLKGSLFLISAGILAKAIISKGKKPRAVSHKKILKYDSWSFLSGILRAYKSPLQFKKKELLITGAVATGIGILFLYDEEISKWFQTRGEKALPVLKDFGWYYGSPENHYAINGGFYIYGLLAGQEEVRKTGVLLITASSAAGLFQTVTKILIGRARPLRNEGKRSFSPFSKENSYYSFPSGHSILSFTTAYAIGTQFKNPFYKGLMYAIGSIAPFSRLWAGAHWITDAVTSICISIPFVNTINKYLEKERNYSSGLDK